MSYCIKNIILTQKTLILLRSKAVDAFISTLERLEEQSLVTKAEAERIKRIVLDEIKLTVSDLKNAA